jgi:hypothetical protein
VPLLSQIRSINSRVTVGTVRSAVGHSRRLSPDDDLIADVLDVSKVPIAASRRLYSITSSAPASTCESRAFEGLGGGGLSASTETASS